MNGRNTFSILVVALIQIVIGIISNLLASGLEAYFPVAQAGFLIFAALSITLLLVIGIVLQNRSSLSNISFLGKTLDEYSLANIVFLMGVAVTVVIMIYLIQNSLFPRAVDLTSPSFWAMSCVWFSSIIPIFVGADFRAGIMVHHRWEDKKSRIAVDLRVRGKLTENEVQLLIANIGVFGFYEAQKAMAKFAQEETWAALQKDEKENLVLVLRDVKNTRDSS